MTDISKSGKDINNLCLRCKRSCKQQATVVLVECRHYSPVPVQLEFKFKAGLKKKISKKK